MRLSTYYGGRYRATTLSLGTASAITGALTGVMLFGHASVAGAPASKHTPVKHAKPRTTPTPASTRHATTPMHRTPSPSASPTPSASASVTPRVSATPVASASASPTAAATTAAPSASPTAGPTDTTPTAAPPPPSAQPTS